MWVFLHDCESCENTVERTFTDNWTGREVCVDCLAEVIGDLNQSPSYDGDNFKELLIEKGLMENDKERLVYMGWIH